MHAPIVVEEKPKGDITNVSLMSTEYGIKVAKLIEDGTAKLSVQAQDEKDTSYALHKGSMQNIENALNKQIKDSPGISFYLLHCFRRDFKDYTTFYEVIQARPMHCPAPKTPGMTLFQWDHKKQELFLLWSLPPEPVLLSAAESDDKEVKKRVQQYLYEKSKLDKLNKS